MPPIIPNRGKERNRKNEKIIWIVERLIWFLFPLFGLCSPYLAYVVFRIQLRIGQLVSPKISCPFYADPVKVPRQLRSRFGLCHEMIRTVSARWVFLLPNAIPQAPTENRKNEKSQGTIPRRQVARDGVLRRPFRPREGGRRRGMRRHTQLSQFINSENGASEGGEA